MAEQRLKFTVFTSAFNAERTLHRVYESLQNQTLRSFEWVVVSDGSVDRTEEIAEKWRANAPFPIHFERHAHSGTAASFNRAVSIARGEFFFQIDHDDGCKPEALERIWEAWREIPEQARPGYAGMYVRSCDENGRPNGPGFGVPWRDATFQEQYYRFRAREDQRPCWVTQIIRKFPAPILQGFSGWLPEGLTHARVGRVYRARWLNEILYVYFQADQGRVSLSGNGSGFTHWPGLRAQYRDLLACDAQWLWYAPIQFYRQAAAYSRYSFRLGIGPAAQWRELGTAPGRALWLAALPAGLALNLMDQARGRWHAQFEV
ncbi:MAG: glycosyltransferase family 2 protein [Acidobacteria bacterium]|nr:MAG: glycosyltransferase family 2 protein [Acidobacteriota bacterium]